MQKLPRVAEGSLFSMCRSRTAETAVSVSTGRGRGLITGPHKLLGT